MTDGAAVHETLQRGAYAATVYVHFAQATALLDGRPRLAPHLTAPHLCVPVLQPVAVLPSLAAGGRESVLLESEPRLCLATLTSGGGGPMSWGSAPQRRLAIMAGTGGNTLTWKSVLCRLALPVGGCFGPMLWGAGNEPPG